MPAERKVISNKFFPQGRNTGNDLQSNRATPLSRRDFFNRKISNVQIVLALRGRHCAVRETTMPHTGVQTRREGIQNEVRVKKRKRCFGYNKGHACRVDDFKDISVVADVCKAGAI